jgi:hypothetical protein
MSEQDFDPATATLRIFLSNNRSGIEEADVSIRQTVLAPIRKMPVGNLSKGTAYRLLMECTAITEKLLTQLIRKHDIDFWFTYIPRLPLLTADAEWVPYATMAVIKLSSQKAERTIQTHWQADTHIVSFPMSEDDLFSCFLIATLARHLAGLASLRRWNAKGATVVHRGFGIAELDTSTDVEQAVREYDARAPAHAIFSLEGIFVSPEQASLDQFLQEPLLRLGYANPPLDKVVLKQTDEQFRIKYFTKPANISSYYRAMHPYDEALEDLFGLTARQILYVLRCFSHLVIISIPPSDHDTELIFASSLNDKVFVQKFHFMLNLCRRGIVRFPEDHLRESLCHAAQQFTNWPEAEARETIDRFFAQFCIRPTNTNKVNLLLLQNPSIVYSSPNGMAYFDLLWFDDFLVSLIAKAKEWFSSQHGDHFTLALKRLVTDEAPGAEVVAWKTSVGKAEVDLLIEKAEVLYAVECKAYAKPRTFWLGQPDATRRRSAQIDKAARQAQRAAANVRGALNHRVLNLPQATRVEWVLCLPTQEFLLPIEKYGALSPSIPRVCTPEELIRHLNHEHTNNRPGK